MDTGARDSLADVISKSLTKLATQPEGKVIFLFGWSIENPKRLDTCYFPTWGMENWKCAISLTLFAFQEVALDDTLLAWPGTFEQWIGGRQHPFIEQLLDLLEYFPDLCQKLELFAYLSYILHTKLCGAPICCWILCVHPFPMKSVIPSFEASTFIHYSVAPFWAQICLNNHPVITVSQPPSHNTFASTETTFAFLL